MCGLMKLTIVAFLLLATGYAQRTRPTRTPPTEEPPTEEPGSPEASGCLAKEMAKVSAAAQNSFQRLLVVPRKGKGRSFRRRFGDVSLQGGVQMAAGESYNNSRGITVISTTKAMLKRAKIEVSRI